MIKKIQPLGKFISNSVIYRNEKNRYIGTLEEHKKNQAFLSHFDIGEPQGTEFYTKQQLIEQGMIGLYAKVAYNVYCTSL